MHEVKRVAFHVFISMLVLSLSACAANMTKQVGKDLKSPALYRERGVKPVDMKAESKCPLPPSISIINAETRENLLVLEKVRNYDINPKELTGSIIEHMKDAFDKCGVKSDAVSKKVMRVSLGETIVESPVLSEMHSCMIQLQIDIPEIKFNRFYQAEDLSQKNREQAMAFAIQKVVWKIIEGAEVRDYILCK
jgi:hypothetical protein